MQGTGIYACPEQCCEIEIDPSLTWPGGSVGYPQPLYRLLRATDGGEPWVCDDRSLDALRDEPCGHIWNDVLADRPDLRDRPCP